MGESRYKQAYNKGIEDGRALERKAIGYSNLDEAHNSGVFDGLSIAIEIVLTLGEEYPDILFDALIEERSKHRS